LLGARLELYGQKESALHDFEIIRQFSGFDVVADAGDNGLGRAVS